MKSNETIKNGEVKSGDIHVLARAVIVDEHHLLLCKHIGRETFYYLPGGHVEHGEAVEAALLREIKEETGVSCTIKRFLGCLDYSFVPQNAKCHSHEFNVVFEVTSPKLTMDSRLVARESHFELVWISMNYLEQFDIRPWPIKRLAASWLALPEADVIRSCMERE